MWMPEQIWLNIFNHCWSVSQNRFESNSNPFINTEELKLSMSMFFFFLHANLDLCSFTTILFKCSAFFVDWHMCVEIRLKLTDKYPEFLLKTWLAQCMFDSSFSHGLSLPWGSKTDTYWNSQLKYDARSWIVFALVKGTTMVMLCSFDTEGSVSAFTGFYGLCNISCKIISVVLRTPLWSLRKAPGPLFLKKSLALPDIWEYLRTSWKQCKCGEAEQVNTDRWWWNRNCKFCFLHYTTCLVLKTVLNILCLFSVMLL